MMIINASTLEEMNRLEILLKATESKDTKLFE